MTPAPRKVVHVITGLEVGGAETVLHRLLASVDRSRYDCRVISLKGDGPIGERLRASGIPVDTLELQRRPADWAGLVRTILRHEPDVVQTWLYHADLIGGLAARLARIPRVVWTVRHANLEPGRNERTILLLARGLGLLSGWMPERIVFNSEAARRSHAAIGYRDERACVIPNGFDTELFRPEPRAGAWLRGELGLAPATRLVGLVARFHPQKDHATFLRAAARLRAESPEVAFVLCGREVTAENPRLETLVRESGLGDAVRLLGVRDDVPRIQAALDLAVSSSCGEAFPNAVGEAMASGVPCVVTDVGDSACLVGDTGSIVPREDPAALAAACRDLLLSPNGRLRALGEAARTRIVQHYSLSSMTRAFEALWD